MALCFSLLCSFFSYFLFKDGLCPDRACRFLIWTKTGRIRVPLDPLERQFIARKAHSWARRRAAALSVLLR